MRVKTILGLIAAMSLIACGGSSISNAELVDACNETVNWGEKSCECMADKAKEDLSADGQRLLYATLTEDQELAEKLAREMTMEEAAQAGMFMVNAGLSCATLSDD